MIDITKNTTPHGLLREIDPEAAAALEAWPHGVEYYSTGKAKWVTTERPGWNLICVYRAIPASKRVVRWRNMYSDGLIAHGYCTREAADSAAIGGRIAVLRVEHDEDGGNVTVDVEAV